MIEYTKTENLFKRNPDKLSELMVGQYTRPEFALINSWDVTEKIHGMNVSIKFHRAFNGTFDFYGRTDKAQFTIGQGNFLENMGDEIRHNALHIINSFNLDSLTVYGELYGPKIQSGGNYSDDLEFRAFDMLVDDKVWLAPDDFRKNAEYMLLDTAPHLGVMSTEQVFLLVSGGFKSTFAKNEDYDAEGIIAKPPMNLYDQRGRRVMFKLKSHDLKHV